MHTRKKLLPLHSQMRKRVALVANKTSFYSLVDVVFALASAKAHAQEVDSLAQQVEHIPFKDGVLGSSPKRITERERSSFGLLSFYLRHSYMKKLLVSMTTFV